MLNFKKPPKIRIKGVEILFHFLLGILVHRTKMTGEYKKTELDII